MTPPILSTVSAALAYLSGSIPPLKPQGYLDPGSGSYLLQLILAGLLGGLFVLRHSWRRIGTFFARLFRRGKTDTSDEQ
jgi:hypothetical protein